MSAEQKLRELGLELPAPPEPVAAYVPAVEANGLLFTSGSGPIEDGKIKYHGKVGRDLSVEEGYQAARLTMLNLLAVVRQALGSLDRVERIVKVTGLVASAPGFNRQPEVMNGASHVLEALFGEQGRHARSAIGVNELPFDTPVEIEMIVKIKEQA
ncbi:MAG: RidA family protein [Chloroflexi bacterium]|nr:MAG: RidA family protein [Chloroflexota bacterium]